MTNKQLAKKIARELFGKADQLRMYRDEKYLGGWAELPAASFILKILDAAKPSGDTKRLDWLHKGYCRNKVGRWDRIWRVAAMPPNSLRSAIDAAMKLKKGKGK